MLVAAVIVPGRVTAQGVDPRPANGANQKPAFAGQTDAPEQKLDVNFEVVTVADNINTGWSVAFLPDGKMLVTERGGNLLVIGADGAKSPPVTGLPPVDARSIDPVHGFHDDPSGYLL